MRTSSVRRRAVVAACASALVIAACGGGLADKLGDGAAGGGNGGSRPSVDAIAQSMHGTEKFSELTDTEIECVAAQIRESNLSDDDLNGILDGSLPASRLDAMDAATALASQACGLVFVP